LKELSMTLMRTIAAVCFSLLAIQAEARPGDLDPSFGTGGIARPAAPEADENVSDAIGTSSRWITGTVSRAGAFHLYVAKLAADGTLDPTFGTAGKSMLRWDYESIGNAIRQQADGKLVVAGSVRSNATSLMLVVRFNADGTLDTSFGTNGTFTVSPPPGYSDATALAIAPDGRIVVAGSTTFIQTDMVVLRLTAAGALDPTFGTGGVKIIDFRGGLDAASGVAVLASGKILVTGTGAQSATNANLDFAAARLNADGSVDTTFGPAGQNGLALYDVGGAYDSAGAMALSGSAIVIGGTSLRTGQAAYELSALRLTADGARDAGFGVNGAAFAAGSSSLSMRRMAVQADGKVVLTSVGRPTIARFTTAGVLDTTMGVGGIATDTDPLIFDGGAVIANADGTFSFFGNRTVSSGTFRRNLAVMRYTANGARDVTFGTGGVVATNLFTLSWDSRAVAIGPTGKVYVAGLLYDTHDADAAVTRLTAQGELDPNGFFPGVVPFGASDDIANAMVVLADGSVVIAGRKDLQGTRSFLLAKLTTNGQLDTANFGNIGRTVHTMGIGFAEAFALVQQTDGKFVSAGYALMGSGNTDFALARYDQNGYLDSTFGTAGVVITPFGALNDAAQAVAIQPDGKIVAAGYTRVGSLFDIAIARYNANGSLDATFGSGGKLVIAASASNDQGTAIAITREGKILVAGYLLNGSNQNIGVVRVNANGTLDTTFAINGIASVDVAGGADIGWGMALQRNGKILIAGQGFDGAANAFVAVRLNDNGTRDASFGTNGVQVIDASPTSDFGRAVAVQPDGRIVIAGTAGTNLAVVRLMGDPKKVTQADANNDGREDLYWRDAAGGLSWWLMNGAVASNTNYQTLGVEWQLVDTGDFNGDGKADLVWRNLNDGTVYVWLLDGHTILSTVSPGAPPLDFVLVGAADLDGDGKSDLVFRSTSTGLAYGWLMNGGAIVGQGPIGNPGTDWKIVDLADFDGDGKADILWQRTTDGVVYTWWMNGLSIRFSFWIAQLDPALWTLVSSGDFNADGTADLLWRSTAGDTWVWLMDGMGGVTAASIGNPGGAWSIKAVGDLDGDGRDDLVWRHTDGTIYYWKMNGTSVTSYTPITNPGGSWQIMAP
jgi:uncharacterized delta-60 repeat protein